MRLSSSAAFWALLASTAPHVLEAKQAKGLRRKLVATATSECTIMAKEYLAIEGEPHREMGLACELDPDDAGGISGIRAPLNLSPHQRADLMGMIFSGEVDPGVDMLDIEGDEITENKVFDKEVKIDPVVSMGTKVSKAPSAKARKQRRLALTTGDLNMLLVRVTDVNGLVYSDDATTMSDEVFGTGGDPANLKSGLEECSWNKINVVPGLGDSNEVATGVIEVTIGISINGSSDSAIEAAAITAVNAQLGISLPGPYDYVLFSLEDCYGPDCGWAAYAYINSWDSYYVAEYYGYPGVLLHELGHNFNLAHSGLNGAQYADHTCTMGNPHFSDDGFQCFNPAKNFQLDWYDDSEITEDPRTAAYSNTLTLVGIGEYDNRGGNPVVVRLETGTGADYFVGFNRATGPNSLNDLGDDQVNIIQVEGGNGQSFSQSWLRALLSANQSYAISNFGGTGKTVTITVNSIDISTAPGTAVISISDGTSTPSPTSNPSSEPSLNPSVSGEPSSSPSLKPSVSSAPSSEPSSVPSMSNQPSKRSQPSSNPSVSGEPSSTPSSEPSLNPSVSGEPSSTPSLNPSVSSAPSTEPSSVPSMSSQPSSEPSLNPSVSGEPSSTPSLNPSVSSAPSSKPSNVPSTSSQPSSEPSLNPSVSGEPSSTPSLNPSVSSAPSSKPSNVPSMSSQPSSEPSFEPSSVPSTSNQPSSEPSLKPSVAGKAGKSKGRPSPPTNPPTPSPSVSASPTSVKKAKANKGDVFETFSSSAKFICQKHEPLFTTICEFGDAAEEDGICERQGQKCGKDGRKCYFAECAGELEASG